MSENIIKMTDGVIRQQKNTILKNVNVEIQSGEFVYLIGKVGSGKSSFLKTLYAELPLEYGNAEVAGFQLKKIKKSQVPLLRRKCGIVFQDFKLLIDRNVYENLEFVLRATGWKNKKAIKERIETVLTKVGMLEKQVKMPHQLSGGEQQRIVLARALLNAPPLILADEPTGNIDPETSYQLVELLKEICETGKTIIIATHQYDLIEKYPGRILCCENGTLFEKIQATACECTDTPHPLPEVEEIIPVVTAVTEASVAADTQPAATPETETGEPMTEPEPAPMILQEIITTEPVKTETILTVENENVTSQETADEDILSLIGKLEYPDITAFDYELDHLPEIETEEKEIETKLSQAQPEEEVKTTIKLIEVIENSPEIPEIPISTEEKKATPPPMDLELID